MNKLILLGMISVIGLLGCQTNLTDRNSTDRNDLVLISKPLGSKQCSEIHADLLLQKLQQGLEQQHIKVFSAEIGTDQRVHIALCGADDGKIAIFKVKQDSVIQAEKMGYTQKSEN
ncbi:hypothetical protein B9T26_01950 [Acinetobacter sp. ANC 4169]|nr:hypothetical protein B9T26_01950 [Acinetobacter sp. ANC 4169]